MDDDENGNGVNLAADEQLMSSKIEEMLQAIFREFESPTVITSTLSSDSDSDYRSVRCRIECSPDSLESVQDVCAKQLNVLTRNDDAGERVIRLQCTISPIVFQQTSLPTDYPQTFDIDIAANDEIENQDSKDDGFRMSEADTQSSAEHENDGITLLLSGGGFRATLFHLGVIRYLRESNRLKDVREIFSISGGSILAAHMAHNYSDYVLGDDKRFSDVAGRLVKFTQQGVREKIIRLRALFWMSIPFLVLLLFSTTYFFRQWSFIWYAFLFAGVGVFFLIRLLEKCTRPINTLARDYERLLPKFRSKDLGNENVSFHILATNLTTGNIASFTRGKILWDVGGSEQASIPTADHPVSNAVAASSSFPALFSPVELGNRSPGLSPGVFNDSQFLTDGGVFDNLGLRAEKLLGSGTNVLVVSDAERKFDWKTKESHFWPMVRFQRTTDIMMKRSTTLEFEILKSDNCRHSQTKFARLQEVELEKPEGVEVTMPSPEVLRHARNMRTDLDEFSNQEVQSLFSAGYLAGNKAMDSKQSLNENVVVGDNGMPIVFSRTAWLPFNNSPELSNTDVSSCFEKSMVTQPKLWNRSSLLSWALVFFTLLTLVLAGILVSLVFGLIGSEGGSPPSGLPSATIHAWVEVERADWEDGLKADDGTINSEVRRMVHFYFPELTLRNIEGIATLSLESRNRISKVEKNHEVPLDNIADKGKLDLRSVFKSNFAFKDVIALEGDVHEPRARKVNKETYRPAHRRLELEWSHTLKGSLSTGEVFSIHIGNFNSSEHCRTEIELYPYDEIETEPCYSTN